MNLSNSIVSLCPHNSERLLYSLNVQWISFQGDISCHETQPEKKEITKEYESYEKRIKIEKLLPGSIYNLTMTVYDKVFKRNVITYVKAVETDRQGKL